MPDTLPFLLTRDEFREAVFARDGRRCVICAAPGVDAHHIVERRLFDDGGYYLDNGATLCEACHMRAEMTVLSCEEIREAAGITQVVLPPHLYGDERYDKWGNILLPNGSRLRGELFYDGSVQKILAAGSVLGLVYRPNVVQQTATVVRPVSSFVRQTLSFPLTTGQHSQTMLYRVINLLEARDRPFSGSENSTASVFSGA